MDFKHQSLQTQVYKTLKKRLLDQYYANGQILTERKLADELQTSRTPVRRDVLQLQKEGWVEYLPKRGILVKSLDMKDLKNIFQIRTALETMAVQLACYHISRDQLELLKKTVDQQIEKYCHSHADPDYQEFIRFDTEFHNTIIESSGNLMLRTLIEEMRDKIKRTGINSLYSRLSRCAEAAEEHKRIVDAIESGDVHAATEVMHHHLALCYTTAHDYILRQGPPAMQAHDDERPGTSPLLSATSFQAKDELLQ